MGVSPGWLDGKVLGPPREVTGVQGIGSSLTIRGHDVSSYPRPSAGRIRWARQQPACEPLLLELARNLATAATITRSCFRGRSPVLDAAQLGILRGYGSERDVAVGDVLFSDGDETYDLMCCSRARRTSFGSGDRGFFLS
jgi:hypothetical protein